MKTKYLDRNIAKRKEIEDEFGESLVDVIDASEPKYFLVFVCVECGTHLPAPVLKFFGWDIEKAKCYRCQGL